MSWRKLFLCIVLLWTRATTEVTAQGGDEEGPFEALRAKYESLPPKGKFCAGAAVGFVGSRLVMKSAMTALKLAGVAFIRCARFSAYDRLPNFAVKIPLLLVVSVYLS